MAVSERSRRLLYERLEEVLGVGQGDVLMEYLPPAGWSDVATRQDLALLEQRMESGFERMDARFAQIDARFAQQAAETTGSIQSAFTAALTLQIRQTVFAIVGVLVAFAGLMAALLGLR